MKKQILVTTFILLLSFGYSFAQTNKNAIKTTFLSWYTGSVKLIYERAILPAQTIEAAVGYIGLTYDAHHNNPSGALFRYSHKFILNYDKQTPLHGAYLKPELAVSSFFYDEKKSQERKQSTKSALMACVGYQWAKKIFTADAYFGVGGAWGSSCDTFYEHGFILWDFFGSKNENIAFTAGIKLGMAF